MSKYQQKQFSPHIYPEWGELISDLAPEKAKEILMAICQYPNLNPDSGIWRFIKSQIDKDYDEFLTRNNAHREAIKNYWQTKENKGEQKETNVIQKETKENKGEPITYNEERITKNEEYIPILSDKSSSMGVKTPQHFDLSTLNGVFRKFNLPQVQKLTDERKRKLLLRCSECGGFEKFVGEVEKALASSSFLRGDNNRGWRADFDFFLQKSSWQKVIEGAYNDTPKNRYSANDEDNAKWEAFFAQQDEENENEQTD